MSSTIFFVACVIRVSNNLVIARENTNADEPIIMLPMTFIEPRYHMIRYVTEALMSPIREDLIIK